MSVIEKTVAVNFGGFYQGIHNELIDSDLDTFLDCYENEIDYELKEVYVAYSKEYIDLLNKYLGTKFEYKELSSPKYYNYTTDKIIVSYTLSDVKTVLRYIDDNYSRDDLINYINEASKSRPGFISFYNGFNEVKKDLDIFLEYTLNYIIDDFNDSHFIEFSEASNNAVFNHIKILENE